MSNRLNRNPEALSNIFYQTHRTRKAFRALTEVIEHGWELKYCKATRLFGPPGIGKSHVLTYFEKIVCAENGWKLLTVEVTSQTTPKKLGEQVLAMLGDPYPEHGSDDDKLGRAKQAIEEQCIDGLVLEEVHFMIDDKTERVNHAVGKWVTNFLNRRACPVILSGELSSEKVLLGNEMLNQRTFPGCIFTRYNWAHELDRDEFRQTLHAIDSQLGMAEMSGLGTMDTAQRIYTFAEGLLRTAADLVAKSRREARERGLPKITTEVLADVVEEFLVVAPGNKPNPFRYDASFDPDAVIMADGTPILPQNVIPLLSTKSKKAKARS